MDRCLKVASVVLSITLSGCSTSPSFVGNFCTTHAHDAGCSSCTPGNAATCESLLSPGSGCTAEGCGTTGCCTSGVYNPPEGCGGCTGDVGKRRRSGLEGGFERGRKNRVLDGAGWVVGIPSKLILWNTKIDSHNVSPETEQQLRSYLSANGINDVKVRINQYDPAGEWKRLSQNKAIHPGWRYTVGALAVTKYTLLPGRLFGNDEFNPFTNSISLFSDRPTIALREGAHAKRAIDSTYRGLYAASMYMPASPLWIDTAATQEVIAYARKTDQRLLEREAYFVLFPSYGARVGQSLLFFADAGTTQAAQAGFALIGHAVGRTKAYGVSDNPTQMVKSVSGIVKRSEDAPPSTVDLEEDQIQLAPDDTYQATFIPLEVTYNLEEESI